MNQHPASKASGAPRAQPVTARAVQHTWQLDLTLVPTRGGFWTPWIPFSLLQTWPFCWWLAVVIDHYSRRVVGFDVYTTQPTIAAMARLVESTARRAEASPKYLVTDLGEQFDHPEFRARCEALEIQNRYASKDSIRATAIIERFFRSLKDELTRRVTISFRRRDMVRQLETYLDWYHEHRPHQGLAGRTPNEVFFGRRPANQRSRFEPRARWPKGAPCAAPKARARAGPGIRLEIAIGFVDEQRRLPIVEIRRAA